MKNIAIQCLLRPALTVVERCADYENFRATLERIDRLLITSEVESQAIELALEGRQPKGPRARRQRASFAIKALREFIAYVKDIDGVWFPKREEISDWYMENHASHIAPE